MLAYIFFILLIFFIFYLNSKKRRFSPINSDKYIVSPIDGYVANIQNLDIDGIDFIELTINFFWYSDRNLFSPIKGKVHIKEQDNDKAVLMVSSNATNYSEAIGVPTLLDNGLSIEITHIADAMLSKINFFSTDFIELYETSSWHSGMNYGFMAYGKTIKLLINAQNELVVSNGQTVVGGESILVILSNSEKNK